MPFTPPVVPSALRARRQWLVWSLVKGPNDTKPRKVPFYLSGQPRSGDQGTPEDLANLGTFEDAVRVCAARGYSGLGFAILAGSGLVALDFDHCVKDGRILDQRIERLISGTYAEVSPSGTGLRAFFAGDVRSRKDNAHKSRRTGGVAGAPRLDGLFDIEVFGTTGFVTITGDHTADTTLWGLEDTVAPLTHEVQSLLIERFGAQPDLGGRGGGAGAVGGAVGGIWSENPLEKAGGSFGTGLSVGGAFEEADLFELGSPKLGWTIAQAREYLSDCSASSSREEWLNALMALHHEFDGSDEALDLADEWSATGDSYAGRNDVAGRWRSFGRRSGAGAITGRWLLSWRRSQLGMHAEQRMRDALGEASRIVAGAVDMLALQTKAMPELSSVLLEFPVLELEVYSLVAAQARRFGTPITKAEFKKLVRVERPPPVQTDKSLPPLTEFGNAERLLRKYGENLMYVPDLDAWFVWSGVYWRPALGGRTEIAHFAKETIRDLPKEADQHSGSEEFYAFCSISQRAQMVNAMIGLAQSDPRVVVPSWELDKYPHFLGAKNGVVDLRTGALLPPDPALRITLVAGCDYDPDARAPLFTKTLSDVFFDDQEMVEYVLRAFGYALTGQPKEDVMFIAFGNGSNGKSTIFNAVREAFGNYAKSAEASSFVSDGKTGGQGGAREDLVRLRGARFVYVNEPDENGVLREGSVKSMTGGDTITARGLWAKSSTEIKPTWTIFMPTNHRPIIQGNDNGIWRRMSLLPFERNFDADSRVVKDRNRREKLLGEMPGILSMIVQAAVRYAQVGLEAPSRVKIAREEYRAQMDLLAEWLDECCDLQKNAETRMSDLWESWSNFATKRGNIMYIKSSVVLGRRLDVRFPARKGAGGVRYRVGIALKTSETLF